MIMFGTILSFDAACAGSPCYKNVNNQVQGKISSIGFIEIKVERLPIPTGTVYTIVDFIPNSVSWP